MDQRVFKLKVTLRGIRPPIWRRIEVPADISLSELHETIQAVMGWANCHLHQFIHGGIYYGRPDQEFGMPLESEVRTRLTDLLRKPKDRLIYEYDFGDSWDHEVILEAIDEAQPEARYPRVVDGKRACPPEDVGGVPGYMALVLAMRDPDHEEHASMLEWVGGASIPNTLTSSQPMIACPGERPLDTGAPDPGFRREHARLSKGGGMAAVSEAFDDRSRRPS